MLRLLQSGEGFLHSRAAGKCMGVIPSALLLGLCAVPGCGGRVEESHGKGAETSTGASAGLPDGAPVEGDGSGGRSERWPSLGDGGSGFGGAGGEGSGGTPSGGTGGNSTIDPEYCQVFASGLVDHKFGTGQDHNQQSGFPDILFGAPESLHASSVVSLGNGGYVVLDFGAASIVDGPGGDFAVFENPLPNFVELATVAVSSDLVSWYEFPCTAAQDGPDYGACAGVTWVSTSSENGVDPFDPDVAGGDWYDLADLALASARYVRITDRIDLNGVDGVFDLDAIAVRHASCE